MNKDEQHFGCKEILKLTAPQLGFLLLWATLLGGILNFQGCSNVQQKLTVLDQKIKILEKEKFELQKETNRLKKVNIKTSKTSSSKETESEEIKQLKSQVSKLQQLEVQLKSKSEKLDANKEVLEAQLKEMTSANGKLSDLVIATLGTVVAMAFAVPALAVISQVIANKETIDKIQSRVKQNVAKELTKLSDNLSLNYLNDLGAYYEASTLSINQAVEKIQEILESRKVQLDVNGSLSWIEKLSENDIKQLSKDDLKRVKIYRYPILLQDCIKVLKILQVMRKISESEPLDITHNNALPIYIKRNLKIVQLPLIFMNHSKHISDKLYVAPKPMQSQLIELNSIIEELKDDFKEEVKNIKRLIKSLEKIGTNIDFSKILE